MRLTAPVGCTEPGEGCYALTGGRLAGEKRIAAPAVRPRFHFKGKVGPDLRRLRNVVARLVHEHRPDAVGVALVITRIGRQAGGKADLPGEAGDAEETQELAERRRRLDGAQSLDAMA